MPILISIQAEDLNQRCSCFERLFARSKPARRGNPMSPAFDEPGIRQTVAKDRIKRSGRSMDRRSTGRYRPSPQVATTRSCLRWTWLDCQTNPQHDPHGGLIRNKSTCRRPASIGALPVAVTTLALRRL